jgi:hypothetical protein
VTQLFSRSELKTKARAPGRDRRRRRIPTGAPRLVESSSDRATRLDAEAWLAFVEMIRGLADVRVELLKNRDAGDLVDCPWAVVVACDDSCRCGGLRKVSTALLRDHYAHLATEIVRLVHEDQRSS